MKFVSHFTKWTAFVGFLFCLGNIGLIEADPTIDFSFTLGHPGSRGSYGVLSEQEVVGILRDRLDLFPASKIPSLARHLLTLCKQYRFDPAFVLSLIDVESGFRMRAVSPAGAIGLMQVMPATARAVLRDRRIRPSTRLAFMAKRSHSFRKFLMDPFANLSIGVAYLASLRDRYAGLGPYYLVAAYNVGPGRLDELLSRKNFKPVTTKRYYERIRNGVSQFRYYRPKQVALAPKL